MSIVCMKRKAKNSIKCLSGKPTNDNWVIRGPGQVYPGYSTGAGFSLNGSIRNIGYIGSNSLINKRGSVMKPGTTELYGTGGNNGQYYNKFDNQTWKSGAQCCGYNSYVKPSVLNTSGMLSTKYKWTKIATNIPQLEIINNRWVGTEGTLVGDRNGYSSTPHIYTENLGIVNSYCQLNKNNNEIINCKN